MRVGTLLGLSILGMVSSSGAVVWRTAPLTQAPGGERETRTPSAEAAVVVTIPGPLELEARIGHAVLTSAGRAETYLLFKLRAPAATATAQPVHVVTLIDRSGSMRGRRLANALSAARGLVSRMRDGDRLTLLAYDTRVSTLLPATTLNPESRKRALSRLDSGAASGNTCISCGLESALADLASSEGHVLHVLLLSDGEATAGERSLAGFQRIAGRAREQGISVSSIGIDLDYNEALLSTLARFSNGEHHFARDRAELAKAFEREISGLTKTATTNATLELDLADGAELVQVFDREVEQNGRHLTVRLGSFGAAEEKTLLVKVRLPEGGPRELTVAEFSSSYRLGERSLRASGRLRVRTSDSGTELSLLDPVVATRLARSHTGATLFEAGKLFKSGTPADFAAADRRLGDELDRVRAGARAGGDGRDLHAQAAALEDTRKRLREARGGHCACAPGDLSCAMTCSAGQKARPAPGARCAPSDPLCAEEGSLSAGEKAAAKESVSASNPFRK